MAKKRLDPPDEIGGGKKYSELTWGERIKFLNDAKKDEKLWRKGRKRFKDTNVSGAKRSRRIRDIYLDTGGKKRKRTGPEPTEKGEKNIGIKAIKEFNQKFSKTGKKK